jgi:hypothetical protein
MIINIIGIVLLQLWFGLDSNNSTICDSILTPLQGKINNVSIILDLIVTQWPNLDMDVFNLISNILVLENDRFDSTKLLKHETIIKWSK